MANNNILPIPIIILIIIKGNDIKINTAVHLLWGALLSVGGCGVLNMPQTSLFRSNPK